MTRPDQPLAAYDRERSRMEQLMRTWIATGDAPQLVAETIFKAATATKPKLRYAAGRQSSQVPLLRLLPEALVDKLLRKFYNLPAAAA